MLANCCVDLVCERPGHQAAEADCDTLGLTYRSLNVHVHLLDVVDSRGIQGAGRV